MSVSLSRPARLPPNLPRHHHSPPRHSLNKQPPLLPSSPKHHFASPSSPPFLPPSRYHISCSPYSSCSASTKTTFSRPPPTPCWSDTPLRSRHTGGPSTGCHSF